MREVEGSDVAAATSEVREARVGSTVAGVAPDPKDEEAEAEDCPAVAPATRPPEDEEEEAEA